MVRIGHFEAWIQAEDERLDEYGLWFDGKEAMTYIVCHRRKPFEVHWMDHGSGLLTAAWIVVDGVPSSGRYIQGSGHTYRTGVRCGPESEIPYTFIEAYGTIELKIAIVKDGEERPSDNPDMIKAKRDKLFKEYGLENRELPLRDVPKQNETTINVSERSGKPAESYIKFKFRYHPHQWLQQRGILTYLSPDAVIAQNEAAQAQAGSPAPRPTDGASQATDGHEEGPKKRGSKRASKRAGKEAAIQERDTSKAQLDDDNDDPDYIPTKSNQRKSKARKPRKSREAEEAPADLPVAPAAVPAPTIFHPPSADLNQATSASRSYSRTTSPQMILRERQRAEYEAEKAKYWDPSGSAPRAMMPPMPLDIQQYPGASNTYMLPSPASSHASSSSSSYSSRLPYARPSARIIDTSGFGRQVYTTSDPSSSTYQGQVYSYASPAPSESSAAGGSSSGSAWR